MDLLPWTDPTRALLVTLVVAAGAAVQGSVGFGWALVAAPVLMLVDPGFIPAPMIVGALVITLLTGLRERRSMDLSGVGWALLGRVPGAVLGAWAVATLPRAGMNLTFALMVLSAVALSLLGARFRVGPPSLFVAGALSGLMGTTSSIGGPPLALLYQDEQGARLRGTLAGFFVLGASTSLVILALFGQVDLATLRAALELLPGAMLGFWLSNYTRGWFDAGRTRGAVLVLAGSSAVVLLLRELW